MYLSCTSCLEYVVFLECGVQAHAVEARGQHWYPYHPTLPFETRVSLSLNWLTGPVLWEPPVFIWASLPFYAHAAKQTLTLYVGSADLNYSPSL